jgi:hypothetical protein
MSESPLYLLRIEGQNFGWVIDDTHDLSTIAGGSRILAFAPRQVERKLAHLRKEGAIKEYRTIQQAASIGLFAVCTGSMPMSGVVQQVRKTLGISNFRHLTFSVEAVETRTLEDKEPFLIPLELIDVELEKRLIAASRFAQMRAPTVAVPQLVADANQACREDHVRPAEGNGRSAAVNARRPLGKYFRWKSGAGGIMARRTVYDFNDMTSYPKEPRWHGKLAVITIDGKGFTKLRDDLCKTAADLKQLSEKLNLLQNAFHIALMEKWASNENDDRYFYRFIPKDGPEDKGRKPGKLLRFQRLVMAGDDATYLMPAWLAWKFLSEFFAQKWELKWTAQTEVNEKTFALAFRAGVVICHAKAPIHPIRDLAHKLESDVAAEDGKGLANPIAYEVLKSYDFIGSGLEEYRWKKRAGLEVHQALLDGGTLGPLQMRLEQMEKYASSGEIKSPVRWDEALRSLNELLPGVEFQESDFFHMSQLRDYIFERNTQWSATSI